MVKCLLPYHIDWLTTGATLCAEMTCPECLAQLAPQGMLHALVPARECGRFFEDNSWKQWDQSDIEREAEKLSNIASNAFASGIAIERLNQPLISKSVERRLEAQTGKKRGKR